MRVVQDYKAKKFILVLLTFGLSIFYTLRNILLSSNEGLLTSVNGLDYALIIQYLGDSYRALQVPEWLPHINNGIDFKSLSPLSFVFGGIIQAFTNNITLSLKIYLTLCIFIGAAGVWNYCNKFVSSKFSILAGILFIVQPFLLEIFIRYGIYTQGLIYAVIPWFLYLTTFFISKPIKKHWILLVVFTSVLVLSDSSFTLMAIIGITFCLVLLGLFKKIKISEICLWLVAITIGTLIATPFWLPSIFVHNNGIKYNSIGWIADLLWLNWDSRKYSLKYFPITFVIIISLLFLYYVLKSFRRKRTQIKLPIAFLWLLTTVTFFLSFIGSIPFVKSIPVLNTLPTGRLLILASISAIFLCIYIWKLTTAINNNFLRLTCMVFIGVLFISDFFPFETYHSTTISEIAQLTQVASNKYKSFDAGRLTWLGERNRELNFELLKRGLNGTDVGNVDGTVVSSKTLYNGVAANCDYEQYILKNLENWNTTTVFADKKYNKLINELKEKGFEQRYEEKNNVLMSSNKKSSYIFKKNSNSIFIGKAPGALIAFPWLVEGKSADLSEYTLNELNNYQLIYLCEPEISSSYKIRSIESKVKELLKAGKTVVIEPGKSLTMPLFGISQLSYKLETNSILKALEIAPESNSKKELILFKGTPVTYLSGLDKITYSMNTNIGELPILGSKQLVEGEVLFVGNSLSQMLLPSIVLTQGMPEDSQRDSLRQRDEIIKSILQLQLNRGAPLMDFSTIPFGGINEKWNNNGVNFEYTLERADQIVISIKYSPRWKVKVDNKPVPVNQYEELLQVCIPEGKHRVEVYHSYIYLDLFSYGISFVGSLLFIIMLVFYKKAGDNAYKLSKRFVRYMGG